MSTRQRMSDSDLQDIDSFIGEWGIGRRLYQELIAERARLDRVEKCQRYTSFYSTDPWPADDGQFLLFEDVHAAIHPAQELKDE